MKVLVVDDSKFARISLVNMLKELRDEVEVFQGVNGIEAVNSYKENSPDIVFLDLTMPIMSGFEALEEIMTYNTKATVVVVSADIQTKAKEKVKELGAKFMVQKPIKMDTLAAILEDLVDGK